MTSGFEIDRYQPEDAEAAVHLLSEAFGKPRSAEWFAWKHLDAPWGPSRGWVARGPGGLAAIRLFTPWTFAIASTRVRGLRAMDGAVAPAAQRRGLFSNLVQREMERLEVEKPSTLVLSTSVPASRAAYLRIGWHPVRPIMWATRLVAPRPSRGVSIADAAVPRVTAPGGRASTLLGTAWDQPAIRWRLDPRSGHRYRIATSADDAWFAYRVLRARGAMVVVATAGWGLPHALRCLIRGVAFAERTPLLLDVVGHGAIAPWARTIKKAGQSTVTVWCAHPGQAVQAAIEQDLWALGPLDLEGVL